MRHADVHGDTIVFTYEDDLWLVPASGGDARRITRDGGREYLAKFSPDGKWLAFTAQYDGGNDVYVMPATGGVPRRLTYHPADNRVLGWHPDGERILFRSNRAWPRRGEEIYLISINGGMPERVPVDRAGLTAFSPDGHKIAYNRISREERTWKRHQGGTAQDIWMGSLDAGDFHKTTDWPGTDNYPMWHGDAIYFLSDRECGTLNIFRRDAGGAVTAMSDYCDYDVKYPSLGDGKIVYQYGERLHLLDLADGTSREVPINVVSDRVRIRPELVDVSPRSGSFSLSPKGQRVLLEVRGELVSLPAEEGSPINLTRTTASREKNAAWSPDGKWVAFISDRTGEEEVYVVDARGEKPWRRLTRNGDGFRNQPVWSPDSKYLLFSDLRLRLNLLNVDQEQLTVIDQGDYDDGWERWGIQDYVFSPDSRWIAYTKLEQSVNESIFLYDLESKQHTRITGELTEDFSPSFSPDGKYLYFLSHRTFNPVMGFVDQNHVFLDMCKPYLVMLQDGEPSPFAPKDDGTSSDDNEANDDEKDSNDDEKKEKEKDQEKAKPVKIDLVGIERRIVEVTGVPAGNYFRLTAIDGGLLYLKREGLQFLKYQNVSDETTDKLDLYHYVLKDKETKKVLPDIANYHLSADGKKLVYRSGNQYGVVDAGKEAKVGDGEIALKDVRIEVDRSAEFLQIFNEAWRIQRDWFYDPGLHGVDWVSIGEKYRRFVPDCGNRGDLNYLIGEMIGELNAGHTYVGGGDVQDEARKVPVGMLGADFAIEPGAERYRIARIYPATPGDPDERSPLDEPGSPVKEGDYLIAIDGQDITTSDNVFAHLVNKADKLVTVMVNDRPTRDGARTWRTKTLGTEWPIRYRAWVNHNRASVDEASGGRIGYVHIPDMMGPGIIELAKVYFPQYHKQGFIIDERYNGGGFVSDMIIDRLERRVWSINQPREGKPQPNPERCFHGPWVVLINEDTGSSGEWFAEAIKRKGLAKLIGMRTWGGVVGIEPHQPLVDGGRTTAPQFAPYGIDGTWPVEGHGVDPDIEVQNEPGDVLRGRDAQLERAIRYVLDELERADFTIPDRPDYPIKAKP
jgi:tricorn protease